MELVCVISSSALGEILGSSGTRPEIAHHSDGIQTYMTFRPTVRSTDHYGSVAELKN